MDEATLRKLGQNVFETICKMFDEKGFRYEADEEKHVVRCTVNGEDIPMRIIFVVRDDRQIVQLFSPMPFAIPEEKRVDLALATTVVNNRLIDGSFDLDMSDGNLAYRMTASYIESILGKTLFEYMLMVSAHTVDDYNDKFMMLAKGMLSVEDFLKSENS